MSWSCMPNYSTIGQGCYRLHLTWKSWFEAAEICRKEGAYLPSFHSADESKAVFKYYHDRVAHRRDWWGKTFWIGGHKLRGTDDWEWWDGSKWDYSPLDASVKKNKDKHCLAMKWDWNPLWVDAPCMKIGERKAFFCKKDKISSTIALI